MEELDDDEAFALEEAYMTQRADAMKAQAAEAERAAVVAWLRADVELMRSFSGPSIGPTKFTRTLERIADAIEAGAHLCGGDDG